jgi:uncharacterized protein DUF5753
MSPRPVLPGGHRALRVTVAGRRGRIAAMRGGLLGVGWLGLCRLGHVFRERRQHGVNHSRQNPEAKKLVAQCAGCLTSRMDRQRRVLYRDDAPLSWFVVDQLSLYRRVGSPETMVRQCAHLLEVASLPNVTLQLLPAIAHPANASELIITDSAAYVEHLTGGLVHTDEQTTTTLERLFSTLLSESYRASDSAAMIRKAGELWTGELPPTQAHKAGRASKSRRPMAS